MALPDEERTAIDSWFSSRTREAEQVWIEKLTEVAALYTERGFTKGEGAILFMLNSILFQVNNIKHTLDRWDEEQ